MNYGGTTEIRDVQALTPELYVGASGIFRGLRLSDNVPIDVEGTITDIKESSWALLTIKTADGISRIRVI